MENSESMIQVKLTFPYLDWPILRQTPNLTGIWKNYMFFINENMRECDYWVVFDHLLKKDTTLCMPENTILITGEPPVIKKYGKNFLNQFATVVTCQREIKHRNVLYFLQGHPWFVNKSYDDLRSTAHIEKTKLISIIVSSKKFTDGHKKRYEFALRLKTYFQDKLDLYGRGIQDFQDKWDVLAPYKYSIAIENFFCDDWITEKLYDCYLTHTFPFYYGCPNINKYFDKESLLPIDIDDFDKSISIIEKTLHDKIHYNSHLPYLLKAKKECLNRYNLFPLIISIIEAGTKNKKSRKVKITLKPENYNSKSYIHHKSLELLWKKLQDYF